MRQLGAALVLISAFSASLSAQSAEVSNAPKPLSISIQDLVDRSLYEPPPPLKIGPFTLTEPQLRGEFIRLRIPIGEYVMRAIDGIGNANRRRKEAAARRKVAAELKAFNARLAPQ
jgi:hypothetical protein